MLIMHVGLSLESDSRHLDDRLVDLGARWMSLLSQLDRQCLDGGRALYAFLLRHSDNSHFEPARLGRAGKLERDFCDAMSDRRVDLEGAGERER